MKGPLPILAFPTRLLTGRLWSWVTTFLTLAAAKPFFRSKFKREAWHWQVQRNPLHNFLVQVLALLFCNQIHLDILLSRCQIKSKKRSKKVKKQKKTDSDVSLDFPSDIPDRKLKSEGDTPECPLMLSEEENSSNNIVQRLKKWKWQRNNPNKDVENSSISKYWILATF